MAKSIHTSFLPGQPLNIEYHSIIPEAPADTRTYGRRGSDATWQPIIPLDIEGLAPGQLVQGFSFDAGDFVVDGAEAVGDIKAYRIDLNNTPTDVLFFPSTLLLINVDPAQVCDGVWRHEIFANIGSGDGRLWRPSSRVDANSLGLDFSRHIRTGQRDVYSWDFYGVINRTGLTLEEGDIQFRVICEQEPTGAYELAMRLIGVLFYV